jgi:hypothetical protein
VLIGVLFCFVFFFVCYQAKDEGKMHFKTHDNINLSPEDWKDYRKQ